MKNLFDLFKKPVETKEEAEQLYIWKMVIVFNDKSQHTLSTSHLSEKESKDVPEDMQKIISWYQNPDELAVKTFYFPNGFISLDADNIHHMYANRYLE